MMPGGQLLKQAAIRKQHSFLMLLPKALRAKINQCSYFMLKTALYLWIESILKYVGIFSGKVALWTFFAAYDLKYAGMAISAVIFANIVAMTLYTMISARAANQINIAYK